MEALDHFLAMGGYARFVWPAYALAVIVLGGFVIETLVTYRKRQRALDEAEKRRR
ncbi:MAG TPA: heme exporter protein CcmD [Stellaceae bacterium]|jgi:heme exporter protein D|nr:heme exporter protein CcmD [Stellaceae bacterium]